MQNEVHKEVDKQEKALTKNAGNAQIVVPDGVRDIKEYKKYIALKDAPALKLPARLIETSDINTVIDPMGNMGAIQKKIVHLPSDEIDDITKRTKAIKVLHFRIGSLREKAFGIKKRKHHNSLKMGLLDERSSELIEYFGQLLTDQEVHKIVSTEWGYDIAVTALTKFRLRHKDKIEGRKQEYIKDYSSLRLAHKRGRLEELQAIFVKRKMKWDKSGNKEDEKMMLAILKQLRDETEDRTLRLEANINANINISIQNHIEGEIMKGLTINDIILARAAQRMNINPRFLITRLHNSFYAKHSGFLAPDGELNDQEIQYPSMMVYNWKDIQKQHDTVGDANIEDAEWEDVTDEQVGNADDIKEILKARIAQKQRNVAAAQDRIDEAKNEQ